MKTKTRGTALARCRCGDIVVAGQSFDMWVESWSDCTGRRAQIVLCHRECNPRADHSKD